MKKLFLSIASVIIFLGTNNDLLAMRPQGEKRLLDDDSNGTLARSTKKNNSDGANEYPPPSNGFKVDEQHHQLFAKAPENNELLAQACALVRQNGIGLARTCSEIFPDTRIFLAICLRDKIGCEETLENVNEAIQILGDLSVGNHPTAMHHLGLMQLRGIMGVIYQNSIQNGYSWIRCAVYQQNENALNTLISCLADGKGCALNSLNREESESLRRAKTNKVEWNNIQLIQRSFADIRVQLAAKQGSIEVEVLERDFPKSVVTFIKEGTYPPEMGRVLELFPNEEITKSITLLASLFFNVADGNYMAIADAIKGIPVTNRIVQLSSTLNIIERLLTGCERAKLISTISLFRTEDHIFVYPYLMNILKNIYNGSLAPFIKAIDGVQEDKRVDALFFAYPYLQNVYTGQGLADMFNAALSSYEDRFNLTSSITSQIATLRGIYVRISALKWVKGIPPSIARDELLIKVFTLLTDCENNHIFEKIEDKDYIPFFGLLMKLEVSDNFHKNYPFLKNLKTIPDLIHMYTTSSTFSNKDLDDMSKTSNVATLLCEIERGDVRAATLQWIGKIVIKKKEPKLKKVLQKLKKCKSSIACSKLLK